MLIQIQQFANFIVALTTPVFLSTSSFGVYFFFGGCTLLTVVVSYFIMPETRGRTLEMIDSSFQNHSWLGNKKQEAQYVEGPGLTSEGQEIFVLRDV